MQNGSPFWGGATAGLVIGGIIGAANGNIASGIVLGIVVGASLGIGAAMLGSWSDRKRRDRVPRTMEEAKRGHAELLGQLRAVNPELAKRFEEASVDVSEFDDISEYEEALRRKYGAESGRSTEQEGGSDTAPRNTAMGRRVERRKPFPGETQAVRSHEPGQRFDPPRKP